MDPEFALETPRLLLERLTVKDAAFMLKLLNDKNFIKYIGDRRVRTEDDALQYLLHGPIQMEIDHGFSTYRVRLKEKNEVIGICGLVKREGLEDMDLGFAFLSEFASQGYGYESSIRILQFAHEVVGLKRLAAITSLENPASIRLLEKLGFQYEKQVVLPRGTDPVRLFIRSLP